MKTRRLAVAAAAGALALTALGTPAFAFDEPESGENPVPSDGRAFGEVQAEEGMNNGRGGFRRLPRR